MSIQSMIYLVRRSVGHVQKNNEIIYFILYHNFQSLFYPENCKFNNAALLMSKICGYTKSIKQSSITNSRLELHDKKSNKKIKQLL